MGTGPDTAEKRRNFDEYVTMMLLAGQSPLSGLRRGINPQQPGKTTRFTCGLKRWQSAWNDAGLDMRHTIREDVDMPWTQSSVKEYLWRPLQSDNRAGLNHQAHKIPVPRYQRKPCTATSAQKFGVTLPPWPTYHGPDHG